ncbi:MAG: TldD/PmbA family protein [Myxococcota bacterium]
MIHWLGVAFAGDPPTDDVVAAALDAELTRTVDAWKGDPQAPYYLSYRMTDARTWSLSARYGALDDDRTERSRVLDVSARVGSPARDSTHRLKGEYDDSNFHLAEQLPLEASQPALQSAIWIATHKELGDAQERWVRVQANQTVMVEDEDPSGDFSVEPPVVDLGPPADLVFDPAPWKPVLIELSSMLDARDDVTQSSANVAAVSGTEYFVSTEGTRIRQAREWVRVSLQVSTTADDGMEIGLYRWKDVTDPSALPDAATLRTWAADLVADLDEMRAAPAGDPYSGPVLLRGRAAGVFVHEVLGHRTEGQRQKDEDEGQTFTDKVGERVLPPTVTVIDDPTLADYAGEDLNGHYRYDQEGVAAQRAVLVEDGVFKGFLMSRSPIEGFDRSNGHGRAQGQRQPVARMANTILQTSDPRPAAELRKTLLAEVKRQGRSYGLLVDEIDGGFTLTGRVMPNAFNVRAVTAWKVYPDGRPDERVRGVDLVGTPLVALSNVIAVGDDPAVFNGFCGAESGMVPNSAVSPSLLLRTLEVQKKEKDTERPPLLPKPKAGGDT